MLPSRHEAQDAARARVNDETAVLAAAVDHRDGVDEAALLRDAERREARLADDVVDLMRRHQCGRCVVGAIAAITAIPVPWRQCRWRNLRRRRRVLWPAAIGL